MVHDHNSKEIKWFFFDIGSTLVDEEAAYRHRIRDMIRGTSVTFEQFWKKRIAYAKEGFNGDQKAIEFFGLTKTPWHSEDEVPFEDSKQTLQALCDKGYKLGIIANQEPGAEERLANWGLSSYFSVIVASAEMGVSKPDKEIFLRALSIADCRPENAVMIGDRLDNDIRPAKELGMLTIRVKKGLAVYMKPACQAEMPDYSVNSLSEILNISIKSNWRKTAMDKKNAYRYISLREMPELKDAAAEWFHSKWGVPTEAYLECMESFLAKETEYGWYLCLDGDRIIGGLGVIENDFHDRKDLAPNVCAVYTEEDYRCRGIAGHLLNMAVEDLRSKGISPVYLVTDHTGFYERYGWEFLCMVQGDGEPDMTRMYIHP